MEILVELVNNWFHKMKRGRVILWAEQVYPEKMLF